MQLQEDKIATLQTAIQTAYLDHTINSNLPIDRNLFRIIISSGKRYSFQLRKNCRDVRNSVLAWLLSLKVELPRFFRL